MLTAVSLSSPRNLQVIHRRPVTHLSTFFHETSRHNGNFPPPPQTNIIVGHVYWCPPTMIAEVMFRFKLFLGKHKSLILSLHFIPGLQSAVCILYPVCSLQSAFYTDRHCHQSEQSLGRHPLTIFSWELFVYYSWVEENSFLPSSSLSFRIRLTTSGSTEDQSISLPHY